MPDAPAPETAILLVCCPDRRGIVASLAQVLSRAVRWHLEDRVLVYDDQTVAFS